MARTVNKEEKRALLMETALKLFLEKGYKSVTTREIAAAAGVSKGVLYDYFENKEALFFDTVRENILKKLMYELALKEKTDTPRERFDNIKALIKQHKETKFQRFRMMSDFIINCPDEQLVSDMLGQLHDMQREYLGKILEDAFPGSIRSDDYKMHYANLFLGLVDGILFQYMITPDRCDLDKTIDLFWEIMKTHFSEISDTEEKRQPVGTDKEPL